MTKTQVRNTQLETRHYNSLTIEMTIKPQKTHLRSKTTR